MASYVLFESASGFALFEKVQSEEIGATLDAAQAAVNDLQQFSKIIKLKAFLPFTSLEDALLNINSISEGDMTPTLKSFLEMNLPKKGKFKVGVVDPKIGNKISEIMGIKCHSDELVLELIRGIRLHFHRFIKGLKPGDLSKAQLGLSHGYSRSKVKFNIHRVDNMIIQAIAILDQLDKDLNTFCMRIREWYSYHFPELSTLVKDNYHFARLAKLMGNKATLTDASLTAITDILGDEGQAKEVLQASRMSMGTDVAEIDMGILQHFADRIIALHEYRTGLWGYLQKKMEDCAPNLAALIGDLVGARLIAHAGSLTNLAKYPASTVQILGAEKALFRALKTKGKTPKYGLIYHSSFIGQAGPKNKGRISRYVANKISLASRIDCFSEESLGNVFGKEFKKQVEERLEFYKSGSTPRKNVDVMKAIISSAVPVESAAAEGGSEPAKKKKNKSKKEGAPAPPAAPATPVAPAEEAPKKKKKKKQQPPEAGVEPPLKKSKQEPVPAAAPEPTEPATQSKKKKKKKSKKDVPS
eukprot:g61485.t1